MVQGDRVLIEVPVGIWGHSPVHDNRRRDYGLVTPAILHGQVPREDKSPRQARLEVRSYDALV